MRLRDRMLDDLKLAGYSPATMREYERCLRKLVDFAGKPPGRIDAEDVRRFLLQLSDRDGLSASTRKVYVCAFRFFFRTTLRRPEVVAHLPLPKVDSPTPEVLSHDEVRRVLDAIDGLLLLAIAALIYDTGLRLQEVRLLMPEDIDSDRMLIHVRQAKGRQGRYVIFGERVLALLRAYYRAARPAPPWLFAGRVPGQRNRSRPSLRELLANATHAAWQRSTSRLSRPRWRPLSGSKSQRTRRSSARRWGAGSRRWGARRRVGRLRGRQHRRSDAPRQRPAARPRSWRRSRSASSARSRRPLVRRWSRSRRASAWARRSSSARCCASSARAGSRRSASATARGTTR